MASSMARRRASVPVIPCAANEKSPEEPTSILVPALTSESKLTAAPEQQQRWPCSNCHCTVSSQDERCPGCRSKQVKIPARESLLPLLSKAAKQLLLERLSPATVTPLRERTALAVPTDIAPETLVWAALGTEEEDNNMEDDELSDSVKDGSPVTERQGGIMLEESFGRPMDPVAVTLLAEIMAGRKLQTVDNADDAASDARAMVVLAEETKDAGVHAVGKRRQSKGSETSKKPKKRKTIQTTMTND